MHNQSSSAFTDTQIGGQMKNEEKKKLKKKGDATLKKGEGVKKRVVKRSKSKKVEDTF